MCTYQNYITFKLFQFKSNIDSHLFEIKSVKTLIFNGIEFRQLSEQCPLCTK